MFAGGYEPTRLALVENRTYASGASILTYRKG
jgi:hypothetical protein